MNNIQVLQQASDLEIRKGLEHLKQLSGYEYPCDYVNFLMQNNFCEPADNLIVFSGRDGGDIERRVEYFLGVIEDTDYSLLGALVQVQKVNELPSYFLPFASSNTDYFLFDQSGGGCVRWYNIYDEYSSQDNLTKVAENFGSFIKMIKFL